MLFDYFDRTGDGNVNYDEFLSGLRGPMNNFRKNLVEQAYKKLDKDGSGSVDMDDLVGVYNTKNHPDVISGKKTEKDVFNDFIATFENYSDIEGIRDGKLTYKEFIDYYTFISCSVDNDQYFELMINNAWRINEGADRNWNKKGWSNTKGDDPSLKASYDNRKDVGGPSASGRKENVKRSGVKEVGGGGAKLATRGCKGFLGIQRQFKIMDDDNDKSVNMTEFSKAMRDYKVELSDNEVKTVFATIDYDGSGKLSIDELVRAIRGEMSTFRKRLVMDVFDKMDRDGNGVLQINDIKGVYSAKNHPDVKSGKRTEDEVLGEFLETFEMHHNLRSGHRDQTITKEEFVEYYNNVSANIDNDEYFELMIKNAWAFLDKNRPKVKAAWSKDFSGDFGGGSKTVKNAPFGTDNEPTNYSTNMRPQTSAARVHTETAKRAGVETSAVSRYFFGLFCRGTGGKSGEELLQMLRNKVASRGAKSLNRLARLFKNMDDDNSKHLDFYEFKKCMTEFRLDYSENDTKLLFQAFDTDKSNFIDYDEFLRTIRGPLNANRKKWVDLAFKKLDKTGNGIVDLDDIRGVYNAKNHPDVKKGKKTEDEILEDFLDTFETGDEKCRDKRVNFEEFCEYYNNISCSIDDDSYFELMIRNAWNLDNLSYKKGWKGEI